MVNLIANREVVRELIQDDLTISNMVMELNQLLTNDRLESMRLDYKKIESLLGGPGASERIAQSLYHDLILTKL